jgi:mannose-6-phosphate isomerase-like protein (cupin superfamily)
MKAPHLFNANETKWNPHPKFPNILTKSLETRESNQYASITLVKVDTDGLIPTHVHEIETETVWIMSGRSMITVGKQDHIIESGAGITIPEGIPHSLKNIGDKSIELLAIHMPPVF